MADGVVEEIRTAAAKGMVAKAVESFGRLEISVNKAGILRDRSCKKISDDQWDIVVDVHLGVRISSRMWLERICNVPALKSMSDQRRRNRWHRYVWDAKMSTI